MAIAELESFEETFRTAYSHGLEAIYAIQTVDLKTVKPIRSMSFERESFVLEEPLDLHDHSSADPQMELDLGDKFRQWIQPFFLQEPVQVLGLSGRAESNLLEHGKRVLEDLINADIKTFIFLKGFGQGHIDEIQKKLWSYIGSRSHERTTEVDFASWVRSLTLGLEKKKAALLFQDFHLENIMTLSQAEKIEMRTLDGALEGEWRQEARQVFCREASRAKVQGAMTRVAYAFVIPWMRSRGGLASKAELLERLQKISVQENIVDAALEFLGEVFYQSRFPLCNDLYEVDEGLFCCDYACAENFDAVMEKAMTYFYKPDIFYPFAAFAQMIARDFAKEWKGFDRAFLESALRRSACFRVRRGKSGELEIRLA